MTHRQDVHLFIPGPAGADPDVLEALAQPIVPHYGPEFVAAYNGCRARLREVFRTTNDLYLMVGPGTGALDAAMASALPDGAPVLVLSNGYFGERLQQMCRAHRARVEVMEFPLGAPIDGAAVAARLALEPRPAAVAWVHHETSTGVLNPVQSISTAARENGVLSIIDAVSSLGGADMRVDDWCVDLCVSVSNKGLASQPGLAAVTVSPQAWAAIDANPDSRGWYFDLRTWRRYDTEWADWHPFPTTVPTGVLFALDLSVAQILEEGLDHRVERTRQAAERTRAGLRALGFEMFSDDAHASPITTAALAHPKLPAAELVSTLAERRIYISGGLDALSGKIIRVGHMGRSIESSEVEFLLREIGTVLASKGALESNGALESQETLESKGIVTPAPELAARA